MQRKKMGVNSEDVIVRQSCPLDHQRWTHESQVRVGWSHDRPFSLYTVGQYGTATSYTRPRSVPDVRQDTTRIFLTTLHASFNTRASEASLEFECAERGGGIYIPRRNRQARHTHERPSRYEMVQSKCRICLCDLTFVFGHDPILGASILNAAFDMLRRGFISAIKPVNVNSFSEVENAFRFIQAGKHMTRVRVSSYRSLKPVASTLTLIFKGLDTGTYSSKFEQQSSYLITGELSGLGRAMCRWARLKEK